MAPDLLSTIRGEIDARLSEMRPLLAEYERLLIAADALSQEDGTSVPVKGTPKPRVTRARRATRSSASNASKPTVLDTEIEANAEVAGQLSSSEPPKAARAARGAAREAILAALGHGSHTLSELVVVTAMSGPNINGNLRKLYTDGVVAKTEREGKAAWALPDMVA